MRRVLRPAMRVGAWLVLFLAVAAAMWALGSAHRTRVRGIPQDFPTPVSEADVPTLGVNVALDQYTDEDLTSALSRVADGGFHWVRQSFLWSQIAQQGAPTGFDWSAVDRLMDALDDYPELRLVAVLDDDPPVPPHDAEQFSAFARAFAERYGEYVDYYQVWDEPNLAAHWGGGPVSPYAYADLLAHAARAVRAADPGARILLAGLAPTSETGPQNLSDIRYLERLYQAGAARYFDIVAAKPYGFNSGPDDRRVGESLLNVSRVLLLRDVMVAHGDAGKAIWASHWGWNALPDGWEGAPSIWGQTDAETQARRSVAALGRARDEWPWMGAMIIETLQPAPLTLDASGRALEDPRWGFSLLAPDGTPRPVYDAIADWAHALPAAAPVGGYRAANRWATYEGGWRVGPLGADVSQPPAVNGGRVSTGGATADRATFRFDGTRVALTVRRGPYRAFLYVTVDGEPANALPRDEHGRAYVVLYDSQSNVTTVPLATGLAPGTHAVEVVAEGGHGRWPLVDWRVGATQADGGTWWKLVCLAAAALVLLTLLVLDARRVRWASLAQAFLALPSGWQAGAVIGVSTFFWAAAALSWGRLATPTLVTACCLVLSLLTLPVLAFLIALRLDVGLTLVAVTAPFYLVPDAMVYRALSLPEILVLLCLAACVALQVTGSQVPRLGWRRNQRGRASALCPSSTVGRIDFAVLLLVLSALVAATAAEDHMAAVFELRTVFLFPALYYALLRLIPLDYRAQRQVVDGFIVGGVGVALIGLGQVGLGQNLVIAEGGLLRLQSVYHSPNSVALYLGRVWPLLVAGLWWGRAGRRRTFSILALVLVTLGLLLSFSRGALLLALPVATLAIGWWAGGRHRWVALTLLAAGGLAMLPLLYLPRFATLLDLGRGTTFFRLRLWQSSLRMIRDHPLLGVGPGNFLGAYRTRYVLPAAWEEFNLDHAHNILLDHWTRLGLLGVLAGLAVQVSFWTSVQRRRPNALGLGLVGSMAALLGHGLVDNAVFSPDLALALFLMLALAHEARGDEIGEGSETTEDGRKTKDVSPP